MRGVVWREKGDRSLFRVLHLGDLGETSVMEHSLSHREQL